VERKGVLIREESSHFGSVPTVSLSMVVYTYNRDEHGASGMYGAIIGSIQASEMHSVDGQ
jgi:hypothetical protein